MDKIRVVIADDHPIFIRGLRQILLTDPALDVVAEAQDGEAALACIQEHNPDVAVLDVDMPKKDGFDVVRAMNTRRLSAGVIFLTMHNNEALFNGALNLGVRGYLLKESAFQEMTEAVKAVARGENYVSPLLTTYLFGRRSRSLEFEAGQTGLKALTQAERRVLLLIAHGKNTAEIANTLYISTRTVEHHRAHICRKLNLQGRDALLRFAIGAKAELSQLS